MSCARQPLPELRLGVTSASLPPSPIIYSGPLYASPSGIIPDIFGAKSLNLNWKTVANCHPIVKQKPGVECAVQIAWVAILRAHWKREVSLVILHHKTSLV